jgi:hypothetical protein
MDEHQRFVMGADILYTSQKKIKPDAELPGDSLVGQFQGQIQGLCLTHGTDDVTTVAFIVWTTGQDVSPRGRQPFRPPPDCPGSSSVARRAGADNRRSGLSAVTSASMALGAG